MGVIVVACADRSLTDLSSAAVSENQCPIRVLGGVRLGGPGVQVGVGGTLPRGLLAVLAIDAGRPVGIDRLTAALWGDDAPNAVKQAVQQVVSRVRRSMRDAGLHHEIRAVGQSYVLDASAADVDLLRFRTLADEARQAERVGRLSDAVQFADAALADWTGAALVDLSELPLFTWAPLLDGERWRTEELRGRCLLGLGRPDEAAAHMVAALTEDPLVERLWVMRVDALAAARRTDEAIRAARTGADTLRDALGGGAARQLASLAESLGARAMHGPTVETGGRSVLARQALAAAVDAERAAAREASGRRSFVEAAQRWERLIDLLGPNAPTDERMAALIGLGGAHNEGGHEREARAAFLRCIELARLEGDAAVLAEAVLGYCSERVRLSPPPEQRALLIESLNELERAIERSGDANADPRWVDLRVMVLARLAVEAYWVAPISEVRELADRAFALAMNASGEARLQAWQARAWSVWVPAGAEELLTVCRGYLDEACAMGDVRHEQLARRWIVEPLAEFGEIEAASKEARRAIEMADELGLVSQRWVSRLVLASVKLLQGELDDTEALVNEALAIGAVNEPETSLDYASVLLWTLRWVQGRLPELLPVVEEIAAAPGADATRRLGLAASLAFVGRTDEADAILDEMTPDALRSLHVDSSWYIALAAASECISVTGHAAAAAVVYELLEPFAERIALTSISATGPVAHHLGVCAAALGRQDQARLHFERAVGMGDRLGMPVFAARSRTALARSDGVVDSATVPLSDPQPRR